MNRLRTRPPTDAEQVDRAVSAVLDDQPVALPPALVEALAMARALRSGLGVVPPSSGFEDALARRLERQGSGRTASRVRDFLRHHQRLVLTGALGSVLISTASAALVARRLGHH